MTTSYEKYDTTNDTNHKKKISLKKTGFYHDLRVERKQKSVITRTKKKQSSHRRRNKTPNEKLQVYSLEKIEQYRRPGIGPCATRPGLGLKRLVRHLVNLGLPAWKSMQRWRWWPRCTDFLLLRFSCRVILTGWCAPSDDALATRRVDLGVIVDGFVATVGAVPTHALRGDGRSCRCAWDTAGQHH